MKKYIHSIVFLALTSCAGNEVMVRSFDTTIIEAAQMAKLAGAEEIIVEVSVVSGYKETINLPFSVVLVGGEKSVSNSTKITAKVNILTWSDPSLNMKFNKEKEEYYILNTKTFKLKPVISGLFRAKCDKDGFVGTMERTRKEAMLNASRHLRSYPSHSVIVVRGNN